MPAIWTRRRLNWKRSWTPEAQAAGNPERRKILYQAWRLAFGSHPELTRRVGQVQLRIPGRRMAAIAAVEGRLAQDPTDPEAWTFKQALYQDLTEAEYLAAAPENGPAEGFDHAYAMQLGQALIQDRAEWRRGAVFLGIAARGMAANGPCIFSQIAHACQREGDAAEAMRYLEKAKQAGRDVGPANLGSDDRQAYFSAVKVLAEDAMAKDRLGQAIENMQLFSEYERSGLETLRILAGLFERAGDPLNALRVTEKALLFNAKDKDLLEKKDRYYYSVMPDDLRARKEMLGRAFDVDYCLQQGRKLLDARNGDLETVAWAQHLADLACVMQPESLMAMMLSARGSLRRGERDQAVELLESIRTPRPEKFANETDEEAWFSANRLLGDLYLSELSRPDLALECFTSFRQSSKSGADTLYKLGLAYEQLGDRTRAVKFYQHVVSYDGHPLASEAHDALSRLS